MMMVRNLKTLVTLVALLSIAGTVTAQDLNPTFCVERIAADNLHVHAFLVFDTDVAELSSDLTSDMASVDGLRQKFTLLASQLGRTDLVATWKVMSSASVTKKNILDEISRAPIGRTDTVFFFYGGHGAVKENGHTLTLENGVDDADKDLVRSDVMDALKAKDPRLIVLLTDCCAGLDIKPRPKVGMAPSAAAASMLPPPERMLRGLFLRHRGIVDINSAATGESAWGYHGSESGRDGGVFTNAFVYLMNSQPIIFDEDGDKAVHWREFYKKLGERVTMDYERLKEGVLRAKADHKIGMQDNQSIWTNSVLPFVRFGARVTNDPTSKKVKLSEVFDTLPAKAAGLTAGEFIVEIDGKPVTDERTFAILLDQHSKKDNGTIKVKISDSAGVSRDVEVAPQY